MVNSASPLRVGLLGYSDIARRRFLPALVASDQALLAAIGSRDCQRTAVQLPAPPCPVLGYEELLAQDRLDLIYLSLPNHLHEEWTIRALEAGKHVICEKPLGLSPASVERMLATAERQGRLLYENLMFLHHPQHAAVKALTDSGRIGRLEFLRSVYCFPLPSPGNFRLDPDQGGGALHDLVRYPLATALYFFQGELRGFRGIACTRERLNLSLQGWALSTASEALRFFVAFDRPYTSYYELIGDRGTIRVERAYTPPADLANRIRVTCGSEDASFTAPAVDQFRLMLEHVCGLIRSGGDFRPPHERSRTLARLAGNLAKECRHGQA